MKKNFMIIDDDKDDRFFFRLAIKSIPGFTVSLEGYNGEDALLKLENAAELPDFIFLDINMPRVNGLECLIELKRHEKFKTIPVIMYSTFFSEQSIGEFYALGAAGYLDKPTDISKLPAQILESIRIVL